MATANTNFRAKTVEDRCELNLGSTEQQVYCVGGKDWNIFDNSQQVDDEKVTTVEKTNTLNGDTVKDVPKLKCEVVPNLDEEEFHAWVDVETCYLDTASRSDFPCDQSITDSKAIVSNQLQLKDKKIPETRKRNYNYIQKLKRIFVKRTDVQSEILQEMKIKLNSMTVQLDIERNLRDKAETERREIQDKLENMEIKEKELTIKQQILQKIIINNFEQMSEMNLNCNRIAVKQDQFGNLPEEKLFYKEIKSRNTEEFVEQELNQLDPQLRSKYERLGLLKSKSVGDVPNSYEGEAFPSTSKASSSDKFCNRLVQREEEIEGTNHTEQFFLLQQEIEDLKASRLETEFNQKNKKSEGVVESMQTVHDFEKEVVNATGSTPKYATDLAKYWRKMGDKEEVPCWP